MSKTNNLSWCKLMSDFFFLFCTNFDWLICCCCHCPLDISQSTYVQCFVPIIKMELINKSIFRKLFTTWHFPFERIILPTTTTITIHITQNLFCFFFDVLFLIFYKMKKNKKHNWSNKLHSIHSHWSQYCNECNRKGWQDKWINKNGGRGDEIRSHLDHSNAIHWTMNWNHFALYTVNERTLILRYHKRVNKRKNISSLFLFHFISSRKKLRNSRNNFLIIFMWT